MLDIADIRTTTFSIGMYSRKCNHDTDQNL